MKLNINKIMILVVAAASLVSCQITKYYDHSTNLPLAQVSDRMVCEYVVNPVTILRTAFAFEEYLGKAEEEKVQDRLFYGKVKILDENSYRISTDWIAMDVTLDASGRSLKEDGSSWKIEVYSIPGFYAYNRSYNDSCYTAILRKETGTDVWVLERENATTGILFELGTDEKCMWVVGTQGEENYSNGVSISFATFGDMSFNEYYGISDDRNVSIALSGQFNFKVYKGNEEMDYCYSTYRAGFVTDYQTSR